MPRAIMLVVADRYSFDDAALIRLSQMIFCAMRHATLLLLRCRCFHYAFFEFCRHAAAIIFFELRIFVKMPLHEMFSSSSLSSADMMRRLCLLSAFLYLPLMPEMFYCL